jgi:hypothetical protein
MGAFSTTHAIVVFALFLSFRNYMQSHQPGDEDGQEAAIDKDCLTVT